VGISDKELPSFLRKLNDIFDWIQQLQSIDTSDVILEIGEPGYSRADIFPETKNMRDQVLSNTDSSTFCMFSVPKVVDHNE
jgi:aspartyl/glutamyl-tRNA(Asn/Gln) amidotransferase C subunit